MLAVDFLFTVKLFKMREIKFKTWDTDRKRFVGDGEIIFKDYGETSIYVCPNSQEYIGDKCHHGESQGSRFIVVQFTGLKDKNGKEIYEGDLLKICENTSGCLLVEFKNAYVGGWVLTHPTVYTWMSLGARTPDSIEVYGNIYENPELLS